MNKKDRKPIDIDAHLRAMGYDPDNLAYTGDTFVKAIVENQELREKVESLEAALSEKSAAIAALERKLKNFESDSDACISMRESNVRLVAESAALKAENAELLEKVKDAEGAHDMSIRKVMRLEDEIGRLKKLLAADEAKATQREIEIVKHEHEGQVDAIRRQLSECGEAFEEVVNQTINAGYRGPSLWLKDFEIIRDIAKAALSKIDPARKDAPGKGDK